MSEDKTQKLKELFGGLFAKLMEFSIEQEFLNSLGESLEIFYDLKPEEEYEFVPTDEFLFLTWFLLDDVGVVGENRCLMDEFIRRKADVLSIQEMQICKALEDTSLNLLEVRGCVPGKSLALRDAFTGETFEVEESMGNGDVAEEGNLLFTRVLKLGYRQGDAADVVILELVDYKLDAEKSDEKPAKKAEPKAKKPAAKAKDASSEAKPKKTTTKKASEKKEEAPAN